MKDVHKKHKHRHDSESDVRVHKKCRRKRDRSRERSRSRSRERSRSRSLQRSRSRSRERSRSRSRDDNRTRERTSDNYDRKRQHNHHQKRSSEYRDHGKGRQIEIKEEVIISDDDSPRRPKGKNKNAPPPNLPNSKWENDENDSRSSDGKQRWGKKGEEGKDKKPMENKAKPDFGLSGKLAEEVNTYKGVVIKYSEPPEARMPKRRWRLYPFKGDSSLPTLYIHRQSAYLIGRDRHIVDLPIDHPSCSKQHAVLQYRVVPYTRENGTKGNRIRPYIIDLESANGTFVNNKKIDPKKYVELLEKDVIKFAYSSREYVLLHEHSKNDEEDDNVILNE